MQGLEYKTYFQTVMCMYQELREQPVLPLGSDYMHFVLDVEIKISRHAKSRPIGPDIETSLGKMFWEHGLGPEGIYWNVYLSPEPAPISIVYPKGRRQVSGGLPGSGKRR